MTKQLTHDIIKVLRDTGVPASTRLQNAAVLLIKGLIGPRDENDIFSVLQVEQLTNMFINMSVGLTSSISTLPSMRSDLSFMIEQFANRAKQIQDEIKIYFRADDEAQIVHPEATVVPPSKEAVRFTRKQGLICQVLIACSDAQTMTGICLTQNDAG